jgi:hypothetical protein
MDRQVLEQKMRRNFLMANLFKYFEEEKFRFSIQFAVLSLESIRAIRNFMLSSFNFQFAPRRMHLCKYKNNMPIPSSYYLMQFSFVFNFLNG